MANWVKIRGSFWELGVLLQAIMLLPVVKLGLRLVGLKRMLLAMTRWAPIDCSPSDQDGTTACGARTVARIVAAAARCGPYRATCLPSSLTLWWVLRRQGVESELRIGVYKSEKGIAAHAWVEQSGTAINDAADVSQRFSPFAPIDAPVLVEVR